MTTQKKLRCIANVIETGDWSYQVFDGDEVVATGISSSEHWVMNDAGGYHTKQEFDARYGEGNWKVEFDF